MPSAVKWLERMAATVNADARLLQRGRLIDARLLFEAGQTQHLIEIRGGRIASVSHGPFVMPGWDFALRAPLHEWLAFWQPRPAPGHHDLFALIKRRVLRVEGDLHPFMSNLFYFKGVLAAARGPAPEEAA